MDKPKEIISAVIKDQGDYGTCWAHSIARNFVRTFQILGIIKTDYIEDFYYLFYKILIINRDCNKGYDYTVMFELYNYLKENFCENIFTINWIGFNCGDNYINEELKLRDLNFDKVDGIQLTDPILKKINDNEFDKRQLISDFDYLFNNDLLFIGKFDYMVKLNELNSPTKAIKTMLNYRLQPCVIIFLNKYLNKQIYLSSRDVPSVHESESFNMSCIKNGVHAINLRKWNNDYIEFKNSHGVDSTNNGNFSVKDLKYLICKKKHDIIFASLMFKYNKLNIEFRRRVDHKLTTYHTVFDVSAVKKNTDIVYYNGDFNDYGLFHSCGRIIFSNGNEYIGEWKNGFFNGRGIMNYSNGDKYEGHWKNDLFNGYGIMNYSNGDKYEGEWKNNLFNGYGIMNYSNGDKYKGQWENDFFDGYGIMTYSNGDIKEGEWLYNEFMGNYTKKYSKYKKKYLALKNKLNN